MYNIHHLAPPRPLFGEVKEVEPMELLSILEKTDPRTITVVHLYEQVRCTVSLMCTVGVCNTLLTTIECPAEFVQWIISCTPVNSLLLRLAPKQPRVQVRATLLRLSLATCTHSSALVLPPYTVSAHVTNQSEPTL